jgi:hypothetical protein
MDGDPVSVGVRLPTRLVLLLGAHLVSLFDPEELCNFTKQLTPLKLVGTLMSACMRPTSTDGQQKKIKSRNLSTLSTYSIILSHRDQGLSSLKKKKN